LAQRGIYAVFHYVPLHTSPAGQRFGRVHGSLKVTEAVSDCLLRLPLYYEMMPEDVQRVISAIEDFYRQG
jgi:dTDP-4-amino-4,6-dideoxygalactose transaminase